MQLPLHACFPHAANLQLQSLWSIKKDFARLKVEFVPTIQTINLRHPSSLAASCTCCLVQLGFQERIMDGDASANVKAAQAAAMKQSG
jgi:hypothetical protein